MLNPIRIHQLLLKSTTVKKSITILLVIISTMANAQLKEAYVGARVGLLAVEGYNTRLYGGLELDLEFENNLGIQYSLLGGKGYFHMPIGAPAGLLLGLIISNSRPNADTTKNNAGLGVFIGVLTALIPESISYDIALDDNLSIAPYISPLQLEFLKNGVEQGIWYAGGGAGVRLHIYTRNKRARLTPYAEYKIHYASNLHEGFSFGGCLSFAI